MKYRYMLFANLIGWTAMSLLDLATEKGCDDMPMTIFAWSAGFIVAVFYILFDRLRAKECPAGVKRTLILTGQWIGTTAAFGVPVVYLAINNRWLVPQAQGGWEHFLNGIEYWLFGVLFIVEPVLIFWAYNGIMALCHHFKKKKTAGGI